MEISRQEYCSGLPFPSPGDLSNSLFEPRFPSLEADFLPSEPPGEPYFLDYLNFCHTLAKKKKKIKNGPYPKQIVSRRRQAWLDLHLRVDLRAIGLHAQETPHQTRYSWWTECQNQRSRRSITVTKLTPQLGNHATGLDGDIWGKIKSSQTTTNICSKIWAITVCVWHQCPGRWACFWELLSKLLFFYHDPQRMLSFAEIFF